jgi:signal transduction protein with GAF and PtsI domain
MPIAALDEACASVRDVFDARTCLCGVLGADGELEFVAGDGHGASVLVGTRLRDGEGIAGFVAQAGIPVEVEQVRDDERFAARLGVPEEFVPTRLLGAPLIGPDERVLGVLNVLDPSPVVVAEITAASGGVVSVLALLAADVARLVADQPPVPDSV